MSEPRWVDTAISNLLRGGVLVSVAVIAIGLTLSFVHHREYLSSREALGTLTRSAAYPSSVGAVLRGVAAGEGQAIVMAGLLLLIATPVARVAFSIVVFAIERDRLYVGITAAVLAILLVAFWIGA